MAMELLESTTTSLQINPAILFWESADTIVRRQVKHRGDGGKIETQWLSQWESAGVPIVVAEREPRKPIPPKIERSVHHMLTNRVRETLNQLLPLLERTARRYYVQVSKVEISALVDPEDESDEVVVTQWVNAPAHVALHYWDKLGLVIEIWVKSLPGELARVANERIAVEVQWQQP